MSASWLGNVASGTSHQFRSKALGLGCLSLTFVAGDENFGLEFSGDGDVDYIHGSTSEFLAVVGKRLNCLAETSFPLDLSFYEEGYL